jgi:hypothetical protein
VLTALATGIIAAGVWWLSSERPAGDSVRASISLPEWPAQRWNPLRSEFFQLKRVDFLGLEQLSAGVLAGALGLGSRPLIDVDPEAVCRRLRAVAPRLAACEASRMLPNRLLVSVRERHPIARLEGRATGFDAEGAEFELDAQEAADLPLLSGELDVARRALELALADGLAIRSAHAERADDVSLELREGGTRLRLGADPAQGLRGWRALLTQLKPTELGGVEVDTRFRGQVILRTPGQGAASRAVRGEG